MISEARDFGDESEAVFELISGLPDSALEMRTQFKNWSVNDIVQHLHFSNMLADMSLEREAEFERLYARLERLQGEGQTLMEATDRLLDGLGGRALCEEWAKLFRSMADRWEAIEDPRRRLKWIGPGMSARSSISARVMETWAHAQAIYDEAGIVRVSTDRIRSIAVLGVNTFGWTFMNRGQAVPEKMPLVRLTAPSGAVWEWGDPGNGSVTGSAEGFCQVVTQVRNVADTDLAVAGEAASRWMALAQCFAGKPNDPPAPGTRFRRTR